MKLLLVTGIKMEDNYIEEWVNHYLNLGVDHIILYNNNPQESKVCDILAKYINSNMVEIKDLEDHGSWVYTPREINPVTLWKLDLFKQDLSEYDWVLFFDADEFLETYGKPLKTILSNPKYNAFDGICVNWFNYSDCNIINSTTFSRSRFTEDIICDASRGCKVIKTIIRADKIKSDFPVEHWIKPNLNFCNALGEPVIKIKPDDFYSTTISNYTYEEMFLKHYRFKTLPEYINNRIHKFLKPKHRDNLELVFYYLIDFFKLNEMTPDKVNYICNCYRLSEEDFYTKYNVYKNKLGERKIINAIKPIVRNK